MKQQAHLFIIAGGFIRQCRFLSLVHTIHGNAIYQRMFLTVDSQGRYLFNTIKLIKPGITFLNLKSHYMTSLATRFSA